mgnify:CR=1 FL=1
MIDPPVNTETSPNESSDVLLRLQVELRTYEILAEISKIVGASSYLQNDLSKVEQLVSQIVEYDDISFLTYNPDKKTVQQLYDKVGFNEAAGFTHSSVGKIEFPVNTSASLIGLDERKTSLFVFTSTSDIEQYSESVEAFNSGFRTFLTIPLISNDDVVGVIQIRSKQPSAYTEADTQLGERIANQIAGALANSLANDQIRLQAAALQSTESAIVITSPSGIIEWVNGAFTRLSGWSPTEAVGQHTSIMKSVDLTNDADNEAIWNALNEGKSWRGVHPSRRKDGSEFPEELTVTPVLGLDGEVAHIIGIKQDVTDRLLAEKTFANSLQVESENRELQRVAAARSTFLSTVSHELRTPLTTVSAFADILFNSHSENLNERQRMQLSLIRKSSTQLSSLIDDLLDISQADTGRLILDKSSFDIEMMIDEISDTSRILLATREQVLESDVKTISCALFADRTRVLQIYSNILTNASKFSPIGSTIRIIVRIKGKNLAVTVTDQGSGISKSDQMMMFSPFFRGGSGTAQPDGRGLGLAVVRSLTDLHDGTITVNSKNDIGTSITVTLPGVISEPVNR